jgi:hypothetical protein
MKAKRIDSDEALNRCSWCGSEIDEDQPVYGLGGKKRTEVDLSEYEGSAIRIALATCSRDVICIVPSGDSPARADGYDLLFMTCSDECAAEMKSVMEEEASLGEALFSKLVPMGD